MSVMDISATAVIRGRLVCFTHVRRFIETILNGAVQQNDGDATPAVAAAAATAVLCREQICSRILGYLSTPVP